MRSSSYKCIGCVMKTNGDGTKIRDRDHFFGIRTINDCVSSQSSARGKTALITHRAMRLLPPASLVLLLSRILK